MHKYILLGATLLERYNAVEKRILVSNTFFLEKNLSLGELKQRWNLRLHEMENGHYIVDDPAIVLMSNYYEALKQYNELSRYNIC